MGLKVVADCVEAVVGAYLSAVGHEAATRVAVAMGAVPQNPPTLPPRSMPPPATSSSVRCDLPGSGAQPRPFHAVQNLGTWGCGCCRPWCRAVDACLTAALFGMEGCSRVAKQLEHQTQTRMQRGRIQFFSPSVSTGLGVFV